jgi:tetratricopeptide (TPR) repeat protein
MLGVPEFGEDEGNARPSPTRAMQDAIIEQVNDLIDDEWGWDAAAEKAYEALAIDPTYGRAANALLRCYLTKTALREMQHALDKLFDRGSDAFNQRHRIAAYSYRVLSRADFWLDWYEELPPEVSDVKDLIERGHAALIEAYFDGGDTDYQTMRRIFREALDKTRDRPALMWYLARLYADKGYFADSAALLGALLAAGSTHLYVQRLYAEMLWWRDHHRSLPWVH